MQDFEKLGLFYLGREYDPVAGQPKQDLVLYDSRDLVTHAVCVGMTGSGKTGLCLSLLEEAAIDGIPAFAIDPKGDLANLLLTFPELRPEDFEPWINNEDARKQGVSGREYAAQQAEFWRSGLAAWGQDGARIRRLREAVDFAIYTPGSTAGTPLSIVKSFNSPAPSIRADAELLRERVSNAAGSLLSLVGIEADPLQSREHILLSYILDAAWREGRDLDLAAIIQQVQNPPVQRVGVLEMQSFFPDKERFAFAMQLNNLIASPGFATWMEGEPLDVGSLLHTPTGKPRMAIISIAHLNDAERMFVVSMLLNEVLSWVRSQSGTTSLRAILYMDEIFGFFPPVANPPSKAPLLALLKQARAFGLGVVLATQNPVDLDYKGLSNAGTWFIGRLQTERDKARVVQGLEGAAAGQKAAFDRARMEELLAGLGNRVFLMNNVHEDAPIVFQTRWTLCYLRGPLTRPQIQQLAASRSVRPPVERGEIAAAPSMAVPPGPAAVSPGALGPRPLLPPEIPQRFIPADRGLTPGALILYRPMLMGSASVHFTDAKSGVDEQQELIWLTELAGDNATVDWAAAKPVTLGEADLEQEPVDGASFAALPAAATKARSYDTWNKAFVSAVCRVLRLDLLRSPATGEYSRPRELEKDFRIRIRHQAMERRDALVEKLRDKYTPKLATLQDRVRRAQQGAEREAQQAQQSKLQSVISIGASVLGAFLGRKMMSASTLGKASTAARGAMRMQKESGDVARAQASVAAIQQQLAELEARFQEEVDALEHLTDTATEPLETIPLKPKKTDISVRWVALAWAPFERAADGRVSALWE